MEKYYRINEVVTLTSVSVRTLHYYDDNERTLLVTMGDAHIVSLSSLLKIICKEEASIPADPEGAIISPKNLNEFLNNHFEHAPSGGCCLMM